MNNKNKIIIGIFDEGIIKSENISIDKKRAELKGFDIDYIDIIMMSNLSHWPGIKKRWCYNKFIGLYDLYRGHPGEKINKIELNLIQSYLRRKHQIIFDNNLVLQ